MLEQIETLRQQAEQDLAAASDAAALESFRVVYLARKGKIAELFDALRNAPPDQRPVLGKHLNALRTTVQQAFDLKAAGGAQTGSTSAAVAAQQSGPKQTASAHGTGDTSSTPGAVGTSGAAVPCPPSDMVAMTRPRLGESQHITVQSGFPARICATCPIRVVDSLSTT